MKIDKENQILKASLATLVHRFQKTDIISTLKTEYGVATPSLINTEKIDDNKILSKARIHEGKLKTAMQEIAEKGIPSPIFVYQYKDRYQVLYPRISYIAALKLKFESIPCILLDIPENDMLVFLATKLGQNKNTNIVELSLVLNRMKTKYKYTQKDIATMLKCSRSQITNIIRLNRLPDDILKDLCNEKLSFGHARVLLGIKEDKLQDTLSYLYSHQLSVRELERYVYFSNNFDKNLNTQEEISNKFQCKTVISPRSITLSFSNDKEREKFIKKILKKGYN